MNAETAYTNPPLTTLFQPTYEIAARLAEMLITLIKGENLVSPTIVFEPELILRASSN